MKIGGKIISRNVEENVSRYPKIYERKTSDVIYVYKGRKKESVNPFSL